MAGGSFVLNGHHAVYDIIGSGNGLQYLQRSKRFAARVLEIARGTGGYCSQIMKFTPTDYVIVNVNWPWIKILIYVGQSCLNVLHGVVNPGIIDQTPVSPVVIDPTTGQPKTQATTQFYPGATTLASRAKNGVIPAGAWENNAQLAVAPSPLIWTDPGTGTKYSQNGAVCSGFYTGRMRKVAQVLLGTSTALQYNFTAKQSHGVMVDPTGKGNDWLIEISQTNGVMAMLLPTCTASINNAGNSTIKTMLGYIPSGGTFPVDLATAIASGSVLQLLPPSSLSGFYALTPLYAEQGWAFNPLGTEAQNTGYVVPVGGKFITFYRWKVTFSWDSVNNKPAAAAVAMVESGQAWDGGTKTGFLYPNPAGGLEYYTMNLKASDNVSELAGNQSAPIFAFYNADGSEEVVRWNVVTDAQSLGPYVNGSSTDNANGVPLGEPSLTQFVEGTIAFSTPGLKSQNQDYVFIAGVTGGVSLGGNFTGSGFRQKAVVNATSDLYRITFSDAGKLGSGTSIDEQDSQYPTSLWRNYESMQMDWSHYVNFLGDGYFTGFAPCRVLREAYFSYSVDISGGYDSWREITATFACLVSPGSQLSTYKSIYDQFGAQNGFWNPTSTGPGWSPASGYDYGIFGSMGFPYTSLEDEAAKIPVDSVPWPLASTDNTSGPESSSNTTRSFGVWDGSKKIAFPQDVEQDQFFFDVYPDETGAGLYLQAQQSAMRQAWVLSTLAASGLQIVDAQAQLTGRTGWFSWTGDR